MLKSSFSASDIPIQWQDWLGYNDSRIQAIKNSEYDLLHTVP